MMLVRAKGVMWGKVRMQIPDWNPFVTIGICIDDLPNVVLDTLPVEEGNHPDFRQNFLATVLGTQGTDKKKILIGDYEICDNKSNEIWKSFLKQAPEGAPVSSGNKSSVQVFLDNSKSKSTIDGCTCVKCNLDKQIGCKCPECIATTLEALTPEQKHENCDCEVCIKIKHPHEFNKPCMCQECGEKFLAATGHKIEYEDWFIMKSAYDKQEAGGPNWKPWCDSCEEAHGPSFHKLPATVAHDDICSCNECWDMDNNSMNFSMWEKKYYCEACDNQHANPGSCMQLDHV